MVTCQRVASGSNRQSGRNETASPTRSSQYRTQAQIGTLQLGEVWPVLWNTDDGLEVKR